MIRFTLLSSLLLLALASLAQEENDTKSGNSDIKTVFGTETRASGFGSFDMIFTGMNDSYALLLGGQGGLIFDKKIIVGFGGYGITTPIKFDGIDPDERLELTGGYGGLVLGYILAPREVFHMTFPLTVGIGGMEVREADFAFDSNNPMIDNYRVENSVFVVVEPGAQLEINITRFFRLALGISYRFTEGVNLEMNQIFDEDTSGLAGNVSFRFGGF